MKPFIISKLNTGGLVTNYYCTSRCAHCLYGCSPDREKKYMSYETALQTFAKVKELGGNSVHVGGGEPFLDVDGLEGVLKAAKEHNVEIEYIETNSSWFTDIETAVDILVRLKKVGFTTLLVSISPFHNEFIPFRKVKGVLSACHRTGIIVYPWVNDFYSDLDSFDENMTHNLEEYLEKFGEKYVTNIPRRYWIHYGGRALLTFKDLYQHKTLDVILNQSNVCHELTDTSHYHFDLYGNYIPGLCSGLAIQTEDVGKEINPEKYPLLTTLFQNGIKGLLLVAQEQGFVAGKTYLSKCHLCYEIRHFLVTERNFQSPEIQPTEFYEQL